MLLSALLLETISSFEKNMYELKCEMKWYICGQKEKHHCNVKT